MAALAEEAGEAVTNLSNDKVVTMYKDAASIVNTALETLLTKVLKPGADIYATCKLGNELIDRLCARKFTKKKQAGFAGVAFPTAISVNECVSNYSPLEGDSTSLKEGDWVKITMACQVGGYPAFVSKTIVLGGEGAEKEMPTEGEAAKLVAATHVASEVAYKLIQPGKTNSEVTKAVKDVADAFGVNMMQGVLMHELQQNEVNSDK